MEDHNSEDHVPCADGTPVSSPQLNILCAICNVYFRASDVIFSTAACGHVFHKNCLTRCLRTSSSCPQCRSHCYRTRIHRIYLNYAERTDFDDEQLPDAPFEWVPMDLEPGAPTDAHLPPKGAIQCGTDDDGEPTYVARVYIENELLPASYVPQKKAVIASWSCQSRRLTDEVEVLVLKDCDYKWVAGEGGSFPEDALKSGYGDTQEVTYTGRGLYEGIQRLGKVHPSHKVLYMAHNHLEVNTRTYEVLVVTPREQADR
ncbi:hypothetical protein KR026_004570 [Drosophila bipectinata]|nr:hypothetical protein KR026_004570 [Drosophila bipectinata]